MNINIINFSHSPLVAKNTIHQKKDNNRPVSEFSYSPFAYQDFNVNFTGNDRCSRLFRTPANFYSTPFNKNGMPETMKTYLNEDYDDRKNMPPIQIWKTVFRDINDAESLEDVKKIYPDEKLFSNLKNKPNTARSSLIYQIQALEDEFQNIPLFKDGASDLGMYLIKKIYLEGKTIKEINKDFHLDINDDYKGLIDKNIEPQTTEAYGIKFPNLSFWNSFVVTRNDFPYEYKPRKTSNFPHDPLKKNVMNKDVETREKEKRPPKFNVSLREINTLSDAMLDTKPETALNKIKRKGVKQSEQVEFIQKYFAQIMSIAAENIKTSEEMRDAFQHSNNSKDRMSDYWTTKSYMKELQSKSMKGTIELFFRSFGADGENDNFQSLLRYADSIKPERERRLAEHDKIQQELEDALAIYEEINPSLKTTKNETKSVEEILKETANENNTELFEFETEAGKIVICTNLSEAFKENLTAQCEIFPKAYAKSFTDYMLSNPKITDSYILSTLLANRPEIVLPDDNRIMNVDEAQDITIESYLDFSAKNIKTTNAALQAIIDTFMSIPSKSFPVKLYSIGVFEFPELIKNLDSNFKKVFLEKSDFTNHKFSYYKKDLSEAELNKAVIVITDLLLKYPTNESIIGANSPFVNYPAKFCAISKNIKNNKKTKDMFKKDVKEYLKEYGGSARVLTDKYTPDRIKMAKLEQFMCNFASDVNLNKYISYNKFVLESYLNNS